MKTAIITGATSGIGEAIAEIFVKNGIRVIICGRNTQKLEENKAKFSKYAEVISLAFDVSDRKSVEQAINSLDNQWKNIDILVNNAGNAYGQEAFDQAAIEDLEKMIDGNIKGLVYVSKSVIPLLKNSKSGHIVNISSISGTMTYPGGTVYCATKSAVNTISEGMRMDLLPYGIKVTNVAPGAVETNFSKIRFKGDESRASKVYAGFEPLKAEDIADAVYYAVSRPDHVQIADIMVLSKAQASSALIKRDN